VSECRTSVTKKYSGNFLKTADLIRLTLGEQITLAHLAGGALVVVALWLVLRPQTDK
jgi:drug/metabolite transporter (DMT)-like permease